MRPCTAMAKLPLSGVQFFQLYLDIQDSMLPFVSMLLYSVHFVHFGHVSHLRCSILTKHCCNTCISPAFCHTQDLSCLICQDTSVIYVNSVGFVSRTAPYAAHVIRNAAVTVPLTYQF